METMTSYKSVVFVDKVLVQEEFQEEYNPVVSAPAHVAVVVSQAQTVSCLMSLSMAKHREEQNLLDSLMEPAEQVQSAIVFTSRSSSPT